MDALTAGIFLKVWGVHSAADYTLENGEKFDILDSINIFGKNTLLRKIVHDIYDACVRLSLIKIKSAVGTSQSKQSML